MAAPLIQALDLLGGAEPGRDRILVLVTDGQVGNEDQVLRLLAPRLEGVRVYAVGIDTAVNQGFLRRLAVAGGGACELVESEDRLDEALDRVRQRIGTPVVTDLELDAGGLGVEPGSVSPPRLPALLSGAPLMVCGRYRGRPEGALALSGRRPGGERWRATVPVTAGGGAALAKVWARAHLRDLEDRYATGATHDGELERRIVRGSLDFGVLSRFTAFVALDTVLVDRDGRLHRVTQPVEVPLGWEWPGVESDFAPIPVRLAARGGLLSVEEEPPWTQPPAAVPRPRLQPPVELPGRRVPPRPPAAAPGRSRRFWRSLAAPLGTPGDPAPPAAGDPPGHGAASATPALDAYRRRAAELARELEAVPREAFGGRLHAVAAAVAALQADLRSAGAGPRVLAPLADLIAELTNPGNDPRSLRDRAVTALRAFAETGS
jgi:Ca-activated chloride channel family protein